MKAIKVKLNPAGVRALLRSDEVRAELRRRANRIAAVAGPGNEASDHVGPNRARASVITTTYEARRAEADDGNLTRALDAGRG